MGETYFVLFTAALLAVQRVAPGSSAWSLVSEVSHEVFTKAETFLLQKAAAEGATLVCCLVVLHCAVRLNVLGISATVVQRLWRKAPWAWVHMLLACTLPMCVLLNKHACTPHFQIIADVREFDATNSSSGMEAGPSPYCLR
jgi:hypothetical protein